MSTPALRDAAVAVLGAGSWGTALAVQFARGGRPVRLWGRDAAQVAHMAASRCNLLEEPSGGFEVSDGIVATTLRPFELLTLRLTR